MSADTITRPVLASHTARYDFGHFIWIGCQRALKAAYEASTAPDPLAGTGMSENHTRRLLCGQEHLTLRTFVVMAVTLGLDPLTVFRTATEDAVKMLTCDDHE